MKADSEGLAQEAINKVREIMSRSSDDELTCYRIFSGIFGAEVEGWDMRITELEEEME